MAALNCRNFACHFVRCGWKSFERRTPTVCRQYPLVDGIISVYVLVHRLCVYINTLSFNVFGSNLADEYMILFETLTIICVHVYKDKWYFDDMIDKSGVVIHGFYASIGIRYVSFG